jgi:hypothetical protein
MRIDIIAVLCVALGLSSCTVIGLAADTASVAGTVVTTTVSTAGDVVGAAGDVAGAAAHTVTGSGSSDQAKKPQ